MPNCAILECRNKSGSHNLSRGGISYHRFPNDPNVKAEWISATGRQNWIPGKTATICSVHFEPNDFVIKDGGRHYLHSIAVPSRNVVSFRENPASSLVVNSNVHINNGATTIEVEIMPENGITVNPRTNNGLLKLDATLVGLNNLRSQEKEKEVMELQAKLKEQDLMIRKLKMRNHRLKKRLFSLKSMESENENKLS